MLHLLVTADVVPTSLIVVNPMMEAICSSETLILIRVTWHNIPDNGILHSHRRENLKSYNILYLIHSIDWIMPQAMGKKPVQLVQIDRACPYLLTREQTQGRIYKPSGVVKTDLKCHMHETLLLCLCII
jgi:hypothetical protein